MIEKRDMSKEIIGKDAADISKGIIAGFVATIVFSILVIIQASASFIPDYDMIQLLSNMLDAPDNKNVGWVAHFVIGTFLWGVLYAMIDEHIPVIDRFVKGMIFGGIAWLLAMVVIMPFSGAGFFGMHHGFGGLALSFLYHLAYGAVLGTTYGRLLANQRSEVNDTKHADAGKNSGKAGIA